jgi:hypothetical protein
MGDKDLTGHNGCQNDLAARNLATRTYLHCVITEMDKRGAKEEQIKREEQGRAAVLTDEDDRKCIFY